MKKWDRESWKNDPWGRNIYGTPPQGTADYAFFQHIVCSLKQDTGRCAILWPHGILFRDSEREIRSNLVESDYIDTIIGLGPNLFYNSPMDSCIVVCRKNKPEAKKNKIMFIRAYDQIYKEGNQNFLSSQHVKNIFNWFSEFKEMPGRTKIASIEEIRKNNYILNVALYVRPEDGNDNSEKPRIDAFVKDWLESSEQFKNFFNKLKVSLEEIVN
jgi:type I restriction enzyme M protein